MINRFHSPKPQPFDQSLPNQLKINHICFIVLMDQFKSEGGQAVEFCVTRILLFTRNRTEGQRAMLIRPGHASRSHLAEFTPTLSVFSF
jgi:hypothetical protein